MDLIVATPGRLIDLFEEDQDLCDLSEISFFVLDEADRMLDQGFEESIKKIFAKLPSAKQTVMFSATWPLSIEKMAKNYLNDPVKIIVGSLDLSANTDIEQRVTVLEPREKEKKLLELLKEYHNGKNRILVFALYKKEAVRLFELLRQRNYNVAAIHGNLNQSERSKYIIINEIIGIISIGTNANINSHRCSCARNRYSGC
jgi:ATP-dependent RNA helicase DBP3